METIFAVSSGAPPAAIAVVRVSGRRALAICRLLCGVVPEPRHATLRALRDPADGALLDRALVLVFPGPNSATGEDLVELHLHGGRAVVAAVEAALAAQPELRRAEPGEFTRRALSAGRIDLAEAEGLGDLLMAETEAQRRAALGSAEGAVSRAVGEWAQRLLMLSARIEAMLDFADEDDVATDVAAVTRDIAGLQPGDIAAAIANPPVERLRDGVRVVLAGPPNSGKSTLLNVLANHDAAIVSPISGTTRDRIDVPVRRDGLAFVLTDTAGLAVASDDPIERIGVARARDAMATADIVLWLGDDPPERPALWVHARADLPARSETPSVCDVAVSAATGSGLAALWRMIAGRAETILPRLDQLVLNQRQRSLCEDAHVALSGALDERDLLIVAEHCRIARSALDAITGTSHVEEMLDVLFGRFCIGK